MATRSEVMEMLVDVLREHNIDESEATEIARDQIDGLYDLVDIEDDDQDDDQDDED